MAEALLDDLEGFLNKFARAIIDDYVCEGKIVEIDGVKYQLTKI